jgi:tetratricopeptide (TPR) repeat protein
VLLAYPCGVLVGFPVHSLVLPLALVAGGATLGLLDGWTRDGRLPPAPLLAALATLLINLLAAGGISFPGVAGNAWLLAAITLNLLPTDRGRSLSVAASLAVTVGVAVLLVLNFLTAYSPVLQSQASLVKGRTLASQGRPDAAVDAYRQATRQDPYDPTPWLHLAQLYHQMYLRNASGASWDQFERAMSEARARDPRSASLMTRQGNWYMEAHARSGDDRHLAAARDAFRRATRLVPQGAMEHARLAWASFLAGDQAAAETEAARALRLDEMHPHLERKLAERVFPWDRGSRGGEKPISVEQRMRQVRNEPRKGGSGAKRARGRMLGAIASKSS